MSPWLFAIFMDGVIREMKVRTMGKGVALNVQARQRETSLLLFTDDAVLLDQSEEQLQRLMKRSLMANTGKSKVTVIERNKYSV